MIHQYKAKGYNVVLDVYSGSVHVVDEVSYDIIGLFADYDKEYIKKVIQDKYHITDNDFEEAYGEVVSLKESKKLFSEDIFRNLTLDLDKRPTFLKALCLNVSHTCNLTCDYCFAKGGKYCGPSAIMSLDVAKKAIDFLIENSGFHVNLDVDFFGGEPLLNWKVVKETVYYALKREEELKNQKRKKKFHFTLTTNGVLLNDEKIEFLNKYMKNVVLSLDGREEKHDKFRKTLSGKGSFKIVVPNFQNFVKKRGNKEYYIRGTYTRNNLDFTKDIQTYLKLGFKRTSLESVVGKPDEDYALKKEDLPKLYDEYEKLADMMMDSIDNEDRFIFYHYMIDLNNGPCIYKRISGCGAGSEYMAVTPTGDLYPCHQFVGNEKFKMGDIFNGVERKDLVSSFKKNNLYSHKGCQNCWAKMYCSGGCAANNFNATGDIHDVYDYQCKLFKKRIEMAIAVKIYGFMRQSEKNHEKVS